MQDEIKAMAFDKITSALRFIKPRPTDYVGSFSVSNRKIYQIYKDYGENRYILKHGPKTAYDLIVKDSGVTSITKRSSSSNASRRSSSTRRSSSSKRRSTTRRQH